MGNGVIVVAGAGESRVAAIREAEHIPSNWRLAWERGIGGERAGEIAEGAPLEGEEWCVVLPAGAVDDADLDRDPAVATYERVPGDSPALAAWRVA